MQIDFINPFLNSTLNVIETMAFIKAVPGKPFLKTDLIPLGDVTGVIGMIGEKVMGSMAIVFTRDCVLKIVSNMLGEEIKEITNDIVDAVGELTNMISGGARKELSELGYAGFQMAIPSMITGKNHTVYHKTRGPVIVIPFEIESGTFYVEACFQNINGK